MPEPRPTSPRISPRPEDDWDDLTREAVAATSGRAGRPVPNIFRTIAHHPAMLRDWWVFGAAVLQRGSLSPRHRELLLLRTGWNCQAEYEWGQHVRVAREAGVTDDEIDAVVEGPGAATWSPLEAALMRAADELHDDSCISDDTWAALAAEYSVQQLIEVPMVVGQYTLVSMTLNSLGVQLDDWIEGFPPDMNP